VFEITSKTTVKQDAVPGNFWDKWGVYGQVAVDLQSRKAAIDIVSAYHNNDNRVVEMCEAHELGHVEWYEDAIDYRPDITAQDVNDDGLMWTQEVDAWLRAIEDGKLTYLLGTLVLDCLNSYRQYTDDDGWFAARYVIEDLCDEPELLAMYQPIEPDPQEQGEGGKPQGAPKVTDDGSDPTQGDSKDSEKGDGSEGSDKTQSDEGGDGKNGDGELNQNEGFEDGEFEDFEGEVKPGNRGGRQKGTKNPNAERDEWILGEGWIHISSGRDSLSDALNDKGWSAKDLPLIVEATLETQEGGNEW